MRAPHGQGCFPFPRPPGAATCTLGAEASALTVPDPPSLSPGSASTTLTPQVCSRRPLVVERDVGGAGSSSDWRVEQVP